MFRFGPQSGPDIGNCGNDRCRAGHLFPRCLSQPHIFRRLLRGRARVPDYRAGLFSRSSGTGPPADAALLWGHHGNPRPSCTACCTRTAASTFRKTKKSKMKWGRWELVGWAKAQLRRAHHLLSGLVLQMVGTLSLCPPYGRWTKRQLDKR